jgi:hypothetical protein
MVKERVLPRKGFQGQLAAWAIRQQVDLPAKVMVEREARL